MVVGSTPNRGYHIPCWASSIALTGVRVGNMGCTADSASTLANCAPVGTLVTIVAILARACLVLLAERGGVLHGEIALFA